MLLEPGYDLHKLPSPPVADLILGHVRFLLRPDYHRVILEWSRKYGSIFKLRLLTEWTVVITDPSAAAHVLATIPGRTRNYTLVDEVLAGPGKISMFGTQDEVHWRNVRKATAPAFSMANVRRYYRGVLSSAGELLSSLDSEQRALGWVDVEPLLQRLMLRATLEGLFEVPDATLVPGFDRLAANVLLLMAESNVQITDPLRAAWYATSLAPLTSRHFARCRGALREVVAFHTNTAARLLARPDPSPDNTLLWACLHRLRHHRTGRKLTPAQLHPEVGMYTTAGFDTTASTVGWCLYAACLHPGAQERVVQELRAAGLFGRGALLEEGEGEDEAALTSENAAAAMVGAANEDNKGADFQPQQPQQSQEGAGPGIRAPEGVRAGAGAGTGSRSGPRVRLVAGRCPGPEELARLPVLNAFVNEVMRMYPATAVSGERTSALPDQPIRVLGLTLPPRVVLWPMVYGIHMSDRNWADPDQFSLDRWLGDPRCAFANSNADPKPGAADQGGRQQQGEEGDKGEGEQGRQKGPSAGEKGGGEAARRFLPFGEGPKNCVGQNFGITVVRAVVALLLSCYHVVLHPDMGSGSSEDTARLTQVAVVTKLTRLRLVMSRREQ